MYILSENSSVYNCLYVEIHWTSLIFLAWNIKGQESKHVL